MSRPVSSLQDVAPNLFLNVSIRLSTFDQTIWGFSLLFFLPYFMPMAMAAAEIEPHVRPFSEKPAPTPVAILGIRSELIPKYSESANNVLSQQL
jgi:hypothetical protein